MTSLCFYVCPCADLSTRGAVELRGGPAAEQHPGGRDVRLFVAMFPYDPASMSPNPDAIEEELPFKEGQIIKVPLVGQRCFCLLAVSSLGV